MTAETRYNVLVVDDEENMLKMLEVLLRGTHFDAIMVTSGEDALAEAQHNDVDVVLLDIMMPDMSGITVCGHLRANPRLSNVPIVMLTALDDYATRREAMQAGATDLMTKPISKQELIAKLEGVLAEHHAGSPTAWRG
jgi:DNA-binding response OmpR family regulator